MPAPQPRPGRGRPTRELAERRQEELLDRALEMFLEKGFELVTLDAIAAVLGMTKRTMYARYRDKRALFLACVQRAIDRWVMPVGELRAAETGDLATTLTAVAHLRLASAINPAGLRLNRILYSESWRFPEIRMMAHDQGSRASVEFLADLFRRHAARGTAQVDDPEHAATAFLGMAVGSTIREIIWGAPHDPVAEDAQIRKSVRLFLKGIEPRKPA